MVILSNEGCFGSFGQGNCGFDFVRAPAGGTVRCIGRLEAYAQSDKIRIQVFGPSSFHS